MKKKKYESDGYGFLKRLFRPVSDKAYDLKVAIAKKMPKRKTTAGKKRINEAIFYYGILLLPMIQFAIMYIGVNINSFLLAFKSYRVNTDGSATIAWQGLDNFKQFFKEITSDPTMTGRLFNSFTVYAVHLFVGTVLAILFSYYIYKQYKGTNFFRVMLFMPSIISSVVLVMIYKYVVDRAIPSIFGVEPLMSGLPKQVFAVVIFYNVMMGFGSNVLMYSNGMSRIPESLTEYAKLEGCTPIKEFFLVTFPLVYPTIETFLIIGISNIFMDQANEFTFFGNNPDLIAGKQTLGYFLYLQVFGNTTTMSTYPYASAAGLVLTMFTIPVVMLARFVLDKFDKGAEF